MNELKECTEKMFEDIKHFDEEGNEYWSARELMPLFEYSKWERFSNAIDNAKVACEKSGYNIEDHFPGAGKMVSIGSKTFRKVNYSLNMVARNVGVRNFDKFHTAGYK